MGNYRLVVENKVLKQLRQVSRDIATRLRARIKQLADNPRPHGYIKLSDGRYRIRQGDYRIIYTVQDSIVTVTVVKVGHRREVYEDF